MVRFDSAAKLETVHLVERLEPHQIIGEWREPDGTNPSWYHLAQSRLNRKRQLELDLVERLLHRWKDIASSESESTYDDATDNDSTTESDDLADSDLDLYSDDDSDDDLDLYIEFTREAN